MFKSVTLRPFYHRFHTTRIIPAMITSSYVGVTFLEQGKKSEGRLQLNNNKLSKYLFCIDNSIGVVDGNLLVCSINLSSSVPYWFRFTRSEEKIHRHLRFDSVTSTTTLGKLMTVPCFLFPRFMVKSDVRLFYHRPLWKTYLWS